MHPRARRRRRALLHRSRPRLGWLVALARALAFFLALQLSGAVHFAIDLGLSGEAAAQHFGDCPDDDEDGKQCPPGCTSCHCAHVSPALPAPFEPPSIAALLPALEVAWSPYQSGAPPSAVPSPLYRPPRV